MNEMLDDEMLDRRLRDAVAYIDDEGFTARVLAKLPPPRVQRSWRAMILFFVTLLGSAAAYVLSDGARFITVNLTRAAAILPPLWLFAGVAMIGFLAVGLALTAAVAQARQS